ncbi:hypothetical protein TNCV_2077551 [Trichonephila clavipes]|nr:hypothetical protein TNCV_2077551 [Trichonephila clavipes]
MKCLVQNTDLGFAFQFFCCKAASHCSLLDGLVGKRYILTPDSKFVSLLILHSSVQQTVPNILKIFIWFLEEILIAIHYFLCMVNFNTSRVTAGDAFSLYYWGN